MDVVFCVESELVVLFYSISTVKKKVEVSQNVAYFDVIYDYQDIFFDSDCKAWDATLSKMTKPRQVRGLQVKA